MSTMQGIPQGLITFDVTAGSAAIQVDEGLYPLEAIYGAAYVFLDRCWVLLDRPERGRCRVTLAAKEPADEAALGAMVGEFANELLACAWRHKITQENRAALEAVTMQALGGAMGPPSLDDLAKFDFSEEVLDDPLGIAVSWEDKYGKKPKTEDQGGGS